MKNNLLCPSVAVLVVFSVTLISTPLCPSSTPRYFQQVWHRKGLTCHWGQICPPNSGDLLYVRENCSHHSWILSLRRSSFCSVQQGSQTGWWTWVYCVTLLMIHCMTSQFKKGYFLLPFTAITEIFCQASHVEIKTVSHKKLSSSHYLPATC